MFAAGVVKILVCTATLAWGVNLVCVAVASLVKQAAPCQLPRAFRPQPAHTVIIKGTQVSRGRMATRFAINYCPPSLDLAAASRFTIPKRVALLI